MDSGSGGVTMRIRSSPDQYNDHHDTVIYLKSFLPRSVQITKHKFPVSFSLKYSFHHFLFDSLGYTDIQGANVMLLLYFDG